jgi:hypothetical protein
VLHYDRLFVGNALGGAADCGAAADLRGGAAGAPAWRAGEARNVTVVVDAAGAPSILIDGERAVAPPAAEADHPAPRCVPPVVPAGTLLRVGASGNAHFNDNWHGMIAEATFAFA